MKTIIRPTEPTPLARLLGIEKLGDFDQTLKTYVLTIASHPAALNFFGTTHGGYLAGVFDDAFGMLAYFIYGMNAATTIKQCVVPRKMLRPSSENRLVFEIIQVNERQGVIYMKGVAKKGSVIVAEASSIWRLRKNRGEE
ncbi:MAG: hypothetical protein ABIH38_02480 [Patescibacteria group bacterium]